MGCRSAACATPDKVGLTKFALDAAKWTLHYYDKYFGIKYPMAKLDMVAIPDFEAGAMENFGCITYRETEMLVDGKTGPIASEEGGRVDGGARDGAPVVWGHGDSGVVGQPVAERGFCDLDGDEGGCEVASGLAVRPGGSG